MMMTDNRPSAEIFKALADANRLKILKFLRNGEKCVCEIIPHVGTSQSNVSQHLRVLRKSGLIDNRKDGKKIIYFIISPDIMDIVDNIDRMAIG